MRLLMSFISEHFNNIKAMLSGDVLNELEQEEAHSINQLKNYLILRNSRRILVFCIVELLMAAISLINNIISPSTANSGIVLSFIGSVLLISVAILSFIVYHGELSAGKNDYKKLGLYQYIFWYVFLGGGMIISIGEYMLYNTVHTFVIVCAFVITVPIFTLVPSIISAAVSAITAVIYGVSANQQFWFYIAVIIAAVAFVWICSERYNCYTSMWVSERHLDNAAERCRRISQTDSLTGMLNKAGLTSKFYERYSSSSSEHKIAVLLIDVDNFRMYNHQYGYDMSDRCLYNICNCIRIFSKPVTDMVSRFGGDDFVLIIADKTEYEVLQFAEQIRQSVETMALPIGDKGIVTISIGISGISEMKSKETYSVLLNEADNQLQIAKRSGKNCIGYKNRPFINESRKTTR